MADFDPDAYLAKKSGGDFDPDAYLASKGEQFTFKGSHKDRINASVHHEQPEASLYDRFIEGLKGAKDTVKGAVNTAYEGIAKPIAKAVAFPLIDPDRYPESSVLTEQGRKQLADDFILTNPAKRRQIERGLSDTITFGLGERLANAADPQFQASAQADAVAAPDARSLGQVTGMFSPGGTSAVAKGAGKVVGKTLGQVATKGALSGAGMGVAKAALGYELSAPAMAGASAAIAGENPIEAARRAATDPFGLLTAGTMGAVTGAGQGYGGKLRDPKTIEGRTIRTVEDGGGQIKAFGEPVRGGVFEDPAITELDKGRAGVNKLADKAAGRMAERGNERTAEARRNYGDSEDAILAEHVGRHHLVSATDEALTRLHEENTVNNGVVGDDGVDRALTKVRRMVDQNVAVNSGDGVLTVPAVEVGELVKIKKLVNRLSDWGQPATQETRVYRELADALSEDAAAIDPRIGEMNAAYRNELEPTKRANDILGYGKKPTVTPSAAQQSTAAGRLGRVGDETQSATLREPRIEELKSLDPEYARQVRLIEAKKALERLRYGEAETSTSIEKGMARSHGKAVKHVAAAVGLAAHGPLGAAIGYGAGKLLEAPLAARVRLGLPVADKLASAGEELPGTLAARLFLARQRQLQLNADRTSASLGGP